MTKLSIPNPKTYHHYSAGQIARLEAGLCYACGNERTSLGTAYQCRPCADKSSAFAKSRRLRMQVAGLCEICTKPRDNERNKNHCRKCRDKVLARNKEKQWPRTLKRAYGLTVEGYFAILSAQGGGCAICGKTSEEQGRKLAVDHCHATGKVRGILCDPCNQGLGSYRDNVTLLRRAIEYLETP
jgi:hypothetical protein